ncbi:uncharacterized protein LOC128221172 [Mya arenaria]|uniref:uncharacterized protein LOC128221172 n=1 Tax=Mya arenaria TaxID=6604 RepID=UPI0022E1FBCA|nr:uncharacterized protein LOC128221172 [Mya arenaria]
MESWDWPNHYKKIAQVYIQPGLDVTNIRFQDISTMFSIWTRCLAFPRTIVNLLDVLKRQRNAIAHESLLITNATKTLHFQTIRNVISIPTIRATIPNYQDVWQMMNDLEHGQHHNFSDDINKVRKEIEDTRNGSKGQIENFKQEVLDQHDDIVEISSQLSSESRCTRNLITLIVLAFGLGILTILMQFMHSDMASLFSWYHGEEIPTTSVLIAQQSEHGDMQRVDPVIYCDNVTMVTRENWGARPPKKVERMETPVSFVFIHHAASGECFTQNRCAREARMLQNYHMDNRSWDDIGYSFMVGEDGNVYESRAWDRVGAHTLGWNNVSISICFMGDYSDKLPTPEALMAAQALIKCGVDLGKVTSGYKLCGHRDVRGTEGPGEMLYREIQTWGHYDCYKPVKPSHIQY